ncbi:MAG TPA: hypothetical protein VHZ24_12110 [Pirellulales bacterium]|jgi:hypothetical protein|nr:hypothetical protein [Pirellulales bacterium]
MASDIHKAEPGSTMSGNTAPQRAESRDEPRAEKRTPRKHDPLATEQSRRKRLATAAPLIDTSDKPAASSPKKRSSVKRKSTFKLPPWLGRSLAMCRTRFGRSMISATVLHAALVIGLGLASVAAVNHEKGVVLSTLSDDLDPFVPETIVAPVPLTAEPIAPLDTALASQMSLTVPAAAISASLSADVNVGSNEFDVGNFAGLLTPLGGGKSEGKGAGKGIEDGKALMKPVTTKFLGSSATGERFAFVIDKSTSSSAEIYDVARFELLRTLSTMKPYHKFYVVFFSEDTLPMFSPAVEKDMLTATPANVEKLGKWVATIERLKGGSGLRPAFDACLAVKPNVIYFLTDGLMSEKSVEYISSNCAAAKIPVNVIGFKPKYGSAEEGLKNLKTIAERTKGTATFMQ